ncbi:MAG TPA: DNA polymerase III subunit delta' [Candidatus Faecaligallichristensenella faecipullorum]|nr:DNA polymerase III subunit delta' [Candidatus Faecaligallichristensenella faecipullorum]
MNYDSILGQSALVQNLRDSIDTGRIVHAYLFCGPEGTGKRTLAEICARALNCRSEGHKPCDQCPACKRFLSGNFPDVFTLQPQKSIGVEEIRQMIAQVQVKPFEGGRHVVIIQDAGKMTAQAQNALLKTLESPPEDVVFFLLTDSVQSLLPTVLSRCRLVRFHPIDEENAVRALTGRGIAPERARLLARLAEGSVGRALKMQEDEGFFKLRSRVLEALNSLKSPSDAAQCALMLKDDKNNAQDAFYIMELWGRDLMVMQDAHLAPIESDQAAALENSDLSGQKVLMSLQNARQRLASNVAWQSVLEMLFLEIIGG